MQQYAEMHNTQGIDFQDTHRIVRAMLLGEALKKARERVGENQADFAKRFGVAQPVLSRWETGQARPSAAVRILIKRILAELEMEAAE